MILVKIQDLERIKIYVIKTTTIICNLESKSKSIRNPTDIHFPLELSKKGENDYPCLCVTFFVNRANRVYNRLQALASSQYFSVKKFTESTSKISMQTHRKSLDL